MNGTRITNYKSVSQQLKTSLYAEEKHLSLQKSSCHDFPNQVHAKLPLRMRNQCDLCQILIKLSHFDGVFSKKLSSDSFERITKLLELKICAKSRCTSAYIT